jgi:recombinational DNA repair protein RecT
MIPRRNKGKQECTFQIGYRGFIKLAYNTGQVAFYNARAVFAGDYFAYELGTEQYIKHRREAPPQAKITHFYAVLRQHNGAADCEVWSVGDVEAHRDRFRSDRFLKEKNKSYQGPWDTDFEAMGCKTLIRELAKRAPLSPELMSQAARDEYIEKGFTPINSAGDFVPLQGDPPPDAPETARPETLEEIDNQFRRTGVLGKAADELAAGYAGPNGEMTEEQAQALLKELHGMPDVGG